MVEEGKEVKESVPENVENGKKVEAQTETQAPTKLSQPDKPAFNLIDAIKTLQTPYLVDPLAKHEFDSYIVEQM